MQETYFSSPLKWHQTSLDHKASSRWQPSDCNIQAMPCNSSQCKSVYCVIVRSSTPSDVSPAPGPFSNCRLFWRGTNWDLGRNVFMQAAMITGMLDTTSAVESYPILFEFNWKTKQSGKGFYFHNCSNREFGPVPCQNIWKQPSSPHGEAREDIRHTMWLTDTMKKRSNCYGDTCRKGEYKRCLSIIIWKSINCTASNIASEKTLAVPPNRCNRFCWFSK